MTRCGECERSAIYVHAAKVEAEHSAMVIAELKKKLTEAEKALRLAHKGQKQK